MRRENAATVGLLEALGVYAIYNLHMPASADLRGAPAHNTDAESSRKQAAWESGALLLAVAAITKDMNAFIIGGIALVAIDMSYKHANAVNPATGKADVANGGQSISNVYPLDNYDADAS